MIKIAFFSDVHGNLVALNKILDAINKLRVDKVIFLGDLCTLGPKPIEVFEKVSSHCDVKILGNHDEYLYNMQSAFAYTNQKIILDSIDFARAKIPQSVVQDIKKFDYTYELNTDFGNILCYHGSPRSNIENISSETSFEELRSIYKDNQYFLYLGGHTHISMQRRFNSSTILNAGSVGQPFLADLNHGIPKLLHHTEFLILEIEKNGFKVEFVQMKYDIKEHVRHILESDLPLKEWLKEQYKI